MAVAITEDQVALGEVVRSFVGDHQLLGVSREALHSTSAELPAVWKQMADLGWLGLHVSEALGGSGASLAETAVVAEELGSGISPGPFLSTVTVSALLTVSADDAVRSRYLPGLVDGSRPAGLGWASGVAQDSGGTWSGTVPVVLGGRWARLVAVVRADDVLILDTDQSGVRVEPVEAIDPSLGLVRIVLSQATGELIEGAAPRSVAILRALASAEAVGGARGAMTMALDYAKVRVQFGRTIGSFQAIKHHLANLLVGVELATALVWDATRGAADETEAAFAAAAAAGFAPGNYREAAQKNIQLLGGIGFTWEHDAHLYLRRAVALAAFVDSVGSAEDDVYLAAQRGVRRTYGVDLPPEAETYRAQAREFLDVYRQTPQPQRRALLTTSGYLVPHWPAPFGRGAGPVEQLVIDEELGEVEVPSLGIGGWVLLTLTQTASQEQIERWIAPSLAGDYEWCQLFSEPGAGSDAAAVQTRGTRVEGGWVVNGQKVWTSGAQNCNRGLATIRTDSEAPKHKGISAMVIDLKSPGVEVRPLREITGHAMFNEVFFDDVFVPDADVVGAVNDGWRVARTTLGNERVTIGSGSRDTMSAFELIELAQRYHDDLDVQRRIARLVSEEHAMRLMNLRQITRAVVGSGPGPEGNITKLLSAEHAQRVTELGMSIAGLAAVLADEPTVSFEYLFDRCLSIAGGTSEITRNVIAERILGLPRDPLSA